VNGVGPVVTAGLYDACCGLKESQVVGERMVGRDYHLEGRPGTQRQWRRHVQTDVHANINTHRRPARWTDVVWEIGDRCLRLTKTDESRT